MSPRKKASSRGAVAVEFALVLPILLVMLLGIFDYGWYFFVDLTATNAVREGARAATTIAGGCPNATATDLGARTIQSYLRGINMDSYANISASCTEASPAPFAPSQPMFRFDVQLNFPQLTGFTLLPMPRPAGGPGNYVALHTKATMRGVE